MASRKQLKFAGSTEQFPEPTADRGDGEPSHVTFGTETEDIEVNDPDVQADDNGEDDDDQGDDAASFYARSCYYPDMRFYDAPIDMGEDNASRDASTRSLLVPDLEYVELHDRRYCKSYFMPNDEHELSRMTLVHQVHLNALDGELTTIPLKHPERILDIGTGTGEWAIRMGELFPECEVVGTDISAVQETSVPLNVFFEIDDAEEPWERPQDSVDLVHMRHVDGAFKNIGFVYRQALGALRPGGWLEHKEWIGFDGDGGRGADGLFSGEGTIATLLAKASQASRLSGRPWADGPDVRLLIEAGFVDVRMVEHVLPIRAEGSRGVTGRMWLIALLEGLEAMTLRLLTEHADMSPETVRELCDQAAAEMVDGARDPVRGQNVYVKILILTGRKPHPHEMNRPGGGGGRRARRKNRKMRRSIGGAEALKPTSEKMEGVEGGVGEAEEAKEVDETEQVDEAEEAQEVEEVEEAEEVEDVNGKNKPATLPDRSLPRPDTAPNADQEENHP